MLPDPQSMSFLLCPLPWQRVHQIWIPTPEDLWFKFIRSGCHRFFQEEKRAVLQQLDLHIEIIFGSRWPHEPYLEIIFRCEWHHDLLLEISSYLAASDGLTCTWKLTHAKNFVTSSYDLGWRETLYQNCIARRDLKLCNWQVFF
jgi:hypothetical protein